MRYRKERIHNILIIGQIGYCELGTSLSPAIIVLDVYDRARSQKSLISASLKLCSVPFQRTCLPRTSVLGLSLFLFHL